MIKRLVCDYLIIGSGAAPLAFLDTLLTELPNKKFIVVDKKARPGGQWVDAYDFVHLHQPSIVYGITSKALEGNWAKLLFTKFMLPWQHRASKEELLTYFQEFVTAKCQSGQVEYFPECVYDFDQELDMKSATFTSLDGQQSYSVEIREKLINGVQGECIIPSLNPPAFPVDTGINLMTPNEIYAMQQLSRMPNFVKNVKDACVGAEGTMDRHFIVLGAGKTAMDTVVFLQTALGVAPSDISWVISNDVWMLSRENSKGPFGYVKALLDANNDKEKAVLAMEAEGQFVRLDADVLPTRFRFPVVGAEEIALMRKIDHKIRRGRVSSIRLDNNNGDIRVAFSKEDQDDWVLSKSNEKAHIFVHCTSPGPFNGKDNALLFPSEQEMTLNLLFAPPISISMSCLAMLETARQRGTLDVAFGRKILENNNVSPNEILQELIQSMVLASSEDKESIFLDDMRSTITQAMFVALLDEDPTVGYRWLQSNRLSMLSIPNFKGRFVEDLESIIDKGKDLGSDSKKLKMIQKVAEKLEPLRGK